MEAAHAGSKGCFTLIIKQLLLVLCTAVLSGGDLLQEEGDAGGKADVHGRLNLVSVQKEELKVVLLTELIPIFWGTGQVRQGKSRFCLRLR